MRDAKYNGLMPFKPLYLASRKLRDAKYNGLKNN